MIFFHFVKDFNSLSRVSNEIGKKPPAGTWQHMYERNILVLETLQDYFR